MMPSVLDSSAQLNDRRDGDAALWTKMWGDPEVVRTRLAPKPADAEYLVLSDLRDFLQRYATSAPIRILDYGAGPSPYRQLFPAAEYRRADLVPTDGLDYVVGNDSRLPDGTGQFDLVLSTQVAEHLAQPINYFREAWRVLRPGGTLIVTTHGVWEEHGAPYDYQRWTTAGLERDLTEAGVRNLELFKLTAGDRAACFLTLRWLSSLTCNRPWACRKLAGMVRRIVRWLFAPAHLFCDRWMREQRIVGAPDLDRFPLYIILAAVARKEGGNLPFPAPKIGPTAP